MLILFECKLEVLDIFSATMAEVSLCLAVSLLSFFGSRVNLDRYMATQRMYSDMTDMTERVAANGGNSQAYGRPFASELAEAREYPRRGQALGERDLGQSRLQDSDSFDLRS